MGKQSILIIYQQIQDLFQKDRLLEAKDQILDLYEVAASNHNIKQKAIHINLWGIIMNTRTFSWLFGVTFVAAGLLGFTPNALVSYDGIFAVNAMHNLVHITTGIAILVAIIKYQGYEGRILKIVGWAYVVVTIVGFLTSGNTLLGIIHINEADRWLHLGLAIVILGAGFLPANSKSRITLDAMGTQ